jgi:hypothetical protein
MQLLSANQLKNQNLLIAFTWSERQVTFAFSAAWASFTE